MVAAAAASRRLPLTRAAVERTPVLIELSLQCSIVKAGFVGQATAHHMVPFPWLRPEDDATNTAQDYYHLFSPVLQQVLHYLALDPPMSGRKVILIFDSGLELSNALQHALSRILLDTIEFQAVAFKSALLFLGMSLIFPTKRESTSLSVYLTETEAQCIVSSAQLALPFTYQTTGTRSDLRNSNPAADYQEMTSYWSTGEGVRRLVDAILRCLVACPRELRKGALNNLFFCGSAAMDATNLHVAKRLQTTLAGTADDPSSSSFDGTAATKSSPDPDVFSELVTSVPVPLSTLKPLADSISLISLPDSIRPDLAVWLGASVWTHFAYKRDPESIIFQWICKE